MEPTFDICANPIAACGFGHVVAKTTIAYDVVPGSLASCTSPSQIDLIPMSRISRVREFNSASDLTTRAPPSMHVVAFTGSKLNIAMSMKSAPIFCPLYDEPKECAASWIIRRLCRCAIFLNLPRDSQYNRNSHITMIAFVSWPNEALDLFSDQYTDFAPQMSRERPVCSHCTESLEIRNIIERCE